MNTSSRFLAAAVLMATLAACGNKGPLVHPSAPADTTTPAPAEPASTDPTGTQPATQQPIPADADPGGAVPPVVPPAPTPPPPADSSGGNG